VFLKYRNKYSAGQQFTGEVTYGAAVSEQDCHICARGDGRWSVKPHGVVEPQTCGLRGYGRG
jgi:hypothetical protein